MCFHNKSGYIFLFLGEQKINHLHSNNQRVIDTIGATRYLMHLKTKEVGIIVAGGINPT